MSDSFTTFTTQNPEVVYTLDVSNDGNSLVVGQQADDASRVVLSLWSLADRQLTKTLMQEEACLAARFSPSGQWLAYSDQDQNMVLHDLRSGVANREAFPLPFTKWISFARNRDRMIAGCVRTQVWDAERDAVIWTLPVEPLPVQANISPSCCALSADGVLVSAPGV